MTLSHLIPLTTPQGRQGSYNYPTLWMTELRLGVVKRLDPAHSVIKPRSGLETRHSYRHSFNFATVTQLSKWNLNPREATSRTGAFDYHLLLVIQKTFVDNVLFS